MHEAMEIETTEKRKNGQPRKLWKECIKKDLEQLVLRRMHTIKRNDKSKLEQNLITPVSRDNGIKMNVV